MSREALAMSRNDTQTVELDLHAMHLTFRHAIMKVAHSVACLVTLHANMCNQFLVSGPNFQPSLITYQLHMMIGVKGNLLSCLARLDKMEGVIFYFNAALVYLCCIKHVGIAVHFSGGSNDMLHN